MTDDEINKRVAGKDYASGSRHGMYRHGMKGTPTYKSWQHMIGRCTNPLDKRWQYYGGRGITVCPEWRDFAVFFSDMGEKPIGTSIDRIDNNGPYCKSNCQWATQKQQTRNYSRNRVFEYRGDSMVLTDWAAKVGLPFNTLRNRIDTLGWDFERAITQPPRRKNPNIPQRAICLAVIAAHKPAILQSHETPPPGPGCPPARPDVAD